MYTKVIFTLFVCFLGKNHTYNLNSLSPNFNVEKSHSYVCANVTVPKTAEGELQVVFSSLRLQAFMDKAKNGEFSSGKWWAMYKMVVQL